MRRNLVLRLAYDTTSRNTDWLKVTLWAVTAFGKR